MKIAVLKETKPFEERVSCTPEISKKLISLGLKVGIESEAGSAASYSDSDYKSQGVEVSKSQKGFLDKADVIFAVRRPETKIAKLFKKNSILICQMEPYQNQEEIKEFAKLGINSFALENVPRITRAQAMDVLSSQSNLSGYRAVIEASQIYGRAFPMMMTAAGTIPPARVLIMGAGVAGLQAVATAKRLGAIVSATDVRPAAKEQVESLGGKFVAVEDEEFREAETAGGYAKQMSKEYQKKQSKLISDTIKDQDIVITTALIPGKPAPKLVSKEMVDSMKPGAIVIDLAVETGGNCEYSKKNQIEEVNGVKIVGYDNLPSTLARDSSSLFAKNLLNFLSPHVNKENKTIDFDWEDETVKNTLVTKGGEMVNELLKDK